MTTEIGSSTTFRLMSTIGEYEGTVKSVKPIEKGHIRGTLKEVEVPGYGTITVVDDYGTANDTGIESRSERTNIPSEFARVGWLDFKWSLYGQEAEQSQEITYARSFIANNKLFRERNKGLYICGETSGSGKTMLGCMLANEILRKHIFTVKYIKQNEYVSMVGSKKPADQKEARAARSCTVLLLDDFGKCTTSFQREAITRLIEQRTRDGHITVYMSAIPLERVRIDENNRIIDTIRANNVILKLPNVSIREKLAAQEQSDFEQMVLNFQYEQGNQLAAVENK